MGGLAIRWVCELGNEKEKKLNVKLKGKIKKKIN